MPSPARTSTSAHAGVTQPRPRGRDAWAAPNSNPWPSWREDPSGHGGRESARRSPWPLAAKVSRELMAAGQPRCQRTAAPRAARWSDGCAHGGNPSSTQSAGARVQPLLTCAPFPALHTLLCPCWRLVSVTRGRTLALSTCCMLPRFRLSRREGNPALRRGIFKANCNPSVYNSSHFIRQDFLNS